MPFRRLTTWLVFWIWLFALGTARAETPESRESAVKTAFLYNFAKFVDWPPESFKSEAAPFVLGIVGADPLVRPWKHSKTKRSRDASW